MSCFADTSFLLALTADDDHTASAERWTKAHAASLLTSDLVVFETTNALRSLHLRGILDAEEVTESRMTLNSLLRQQNLLCRPLRPRLLTAEAYRLLDHFSPDLPLVSIPPPPDPPFDIETFEPVDPPWPAIREWIPADDSDFLIESEFVAHSQPRLPENQTPGARNPEPARPTPIDAPQPSSSPLSPQTPALPRPAQPVKPPLTPQTPSHQPPK